MGKKKESVASLGRTLINRKKRQQQWTASNKRHDKDDDSEVSKMNLRSITAENTLDEFLSVAELAGTQFVAERQNIQIVSPVTGALPTEFEKIANLTAQEENKSSLLIPRRPNWNVETTSEELDRLENDTFLSWRRELAELQEKENVVMTPFERNIEVWKQLWRVIERSDVVVQILDARNPLLFLSHDLQKYVKEVDGEKMNIVLLNKGDLLTLDQRQEWAKYFDSIGIKAIFFSALQQIEEKGDEEDVNETVEDKISNLNIDDGKNKTKLLSKEELVKYFKSVYTRESRVKAGITTIGLVGYPNVGKSSTINALLQTKKVSVSSTPGKTKHFQTLYVDDQLMLCDCPGLVFPNFVSCKAEMIINGILPIDQMTEHLSPIALVVTMFPRYVFEDKYGINLPIKSEDPNEELGAEELLNAHGFMRGYMTHRGLPDTSRAAKFILKDIINGKLIYCFAPPGCNQKEFNRFPRKKEPVPQEDSSESKTMSSTCPYQTPQQELIMRGNKLTEGEFNKQYFGMSNSKAHVKGIHGIRGYTGVNSNGPDGSTLMMTTSNGSLVGKPWKKHNNRNKRQKLRITYAHLDKH